MPEDLREALNQDKNWKQIQQGKKQKAKEIESREMKA